jgi:hypothetical protein
VHIINTRAQFPPALTQHPSAKVGLLFEGSFTELESSFTERE